MSKLAVEGGKPVSDKLISLIKPVFTHKDKDDIWKVLDSGYVRMGPFTKKFEDNFASMVGSKYAYAVSNGTAALHVAYLSTLKPGDEVIAPAFTFIATVSTVMFCNAKPVFADIDPETFLIDPESIKDRITKKTKAIAPVHLFGNSADMDAINEIAEDYNLLVINDCAQAHGTEYNGKDLGAYDDLNCYSFYPSKTLTTGEGGIVTTNDPELYRLGCLIRSHGDESRYNHVIMGLNYRITDIMSVIGLNQLAKMNEFITKRRENAEAIIQGLKKVESVHPQKITEKTNPSYSYFSVVIDTDKLRCNRDEFMKALIAENIDCAAHYPTPLTRQPIIQKLMKPCKCPISEDVSQRILSLPVHPYLSKDDLNNIVEAVKKVEVYYSKY